MGDEGMVKKDNAFLTQDTSPKNQKIINSDTHNDDDDDHDHVVACGHVIKPH